jgi:polysaccharide chain length determinant protein (PEP-CTERM system associated)
MQMRPEQIARALINEVFHSRRLVVGLFVAVNVATLAAGLRWTSLYTSSTTILVDDRNIVQPLMSGAAVPTEVTDRSKNAREVIYGRKIMDQILENGGWLTSRPTPEGQERIIEGIKKRTTIAAIGRNIIKIEYRDDDPERAFGVTTRFAELFIQESIAAKAAESSAAFDFIDQQTEEYHDKLARTEGELKELRSSSVDGRSGGDVEVNARLKALYARIESASQELREAEVKGVLLQRQVSGEAETTAALRRESQYRARIGELESKLDTLRLTYHDTHPDIVQVMRQIQDLTDVINAQRLRLEQTKRSGPSEADESVVNNPVYQQLRRELSQNEGTIDALKARIEEAQQQLQNEVSRGKRNQIGDARLAELTRDYEVNRDIYQDLLRRRENARVSMNLDRDKQGFTLKIQEPATMPQSPSGPRFLHFVAGGLLLGILVPLGLLFARLNFDPRVRVGSTISTRYKGLVAVVVPHLWSPKELKSLRWEFLILTAAVGATLVMSVALSMLRMTKVM